MTCDRIWRNCFVKHLNVTSPWRNRDADTLSPMRNEVFYVEAAPYEAKVLSAYVRDEAHAERIRSAANLTNDVRGLFFIVARSGLFVQYYPFLNFNDAGLKWEKIDTVKFSKLSELDDKIPFKKKS